MLGELTEVQAFDLQLDALKLERGKTPPELTELTAKRDQLQTRLERKRQEVDDLRRKVNANELELKSMGERRRGAADSAMRATSVKEASQFQNQELQFATRVQELEEDTLPLMESLERDLLPRDAAATAALYGIEPLGLDRAISRALAEWERFCLEVTDWDRERYLRLV